MQRIVVFLSCLSLSLSDCIDFTATMIIIIGYYCTLISLVIVDFTDYTATMIIIIGYYCTLIKFSHSNSVS
jgi:hypothetical protein